VPATGPFERDRAAIERLHQQDIEATLSDKADEPVKLWNRDAVRLQAGRPAEVGRDVIYSNDKRWEANLKGGRTLSYKPDSSRTFRSPEIGLLSGMTSRSCTGRPPPENRQRCEVRPCAFSRSRRTAPGDSPG
jgi:hypothetical protein